LGGFVVVDDTQALGIFGQPETSSPYGTGGGGSLRRLAIGHGAILVVSSLAKAFGVPVAMLGGSSRLVAKFRERSATRIYCSPPSAAVLAATRRALEVNRSFGNSLRERLAVTVAGFRRGLARLNLLAVPGCFPVQPLGLPKGAHATFLYRSLLRTGVRAVLHRESAEAFTRISFVFTAQHKLNEVDRALEGLSDALRHSCFETQKGVPRQWRMLKDMAMGVRTTTVNTVDTVDGGELANGGVGAEVAEGDRVGHGWVLIVLPRR
jgi:8-amino-7-oxononanoate synthase